MLPVVARSALSSFSLPPLRLETRRQPALLMARGEGGGTSNMRNLNVTSSEESEFVRETTRIVNAVEELAQSKKQTEMDAEEADWKCYLRGVLGEEKEK